MGLSVDEAILSEGARREESRGKGQNCGKKGVRGTANGSGKFFFFLFFLFPSCFFVDPDPLYFRPLFFFLLSCLRAEK
jgi:hypothetical protein